ncbi:MAG: hypothetical protein ABI723_02990 [Bacteroidia bacterium]
MKKITLFTTLAILIALTINIQNANARSWRINYLSNYNFAGSIWGDNFGGTSLNPVFNNLANAQSSTLVQNNDTLYLEGCPTLNSFAGVALTKPFVIIGTGYFLSLNANTSNDLLESRLNNINFNAGSSGSQIIGVSISSYQGIQVNTNNITIKRCYIPQNAAISIALNVLDITINENFFDNTTLTTSAIVFSYQGGPGAGFVVRNNIFKRPLLVQYSTTVYGIETCNNNVFDCPPITGGPSVQMICNSFKNNIIKNAALTVNINSGTPSSKVTYNSIAAPTQLDTAVAYNNKYVNNMANLFVAATSSTDGNYRLKAASAYNYNGSDGAPRGAYGGASVTSRYALSGNAAIPVVYDITTTGIATQATGLPVTIKARTIK